MEFSSQHVPYVMGAFIFAGSVLTTLAVWTLQKDRKARLALEKWKSDETKA